LTFRQAGYDDIPRLNFIANHPAVFPYVSDGTPIDFANPPQTDDPPAEAITFMDDFCSMSFVRQGNHSWEFHTMFLPEGRGRHGLAFAKRALAAMFDEHGAIALTTLTPDDAPHASPPLSFGFKKLERIDSYIRGVGAQKWAVTMQTRRRF